MDVSCGGFVLMQSCWLFCLCEIVVGVLSVIDPQGRCMRMEQRTSCYQSPPVSIDDEFQKCMNMGATDDEPATVIAVGCLHTSSVGLRAVKVNKNGLLNYKAKHVFYPPENRKFRCRCDYHWTSVFEVYKSSSSI
ncbi:hypothetical protein CTI12_AA610460 [Artemisia annua]|uniref:Uncharacterized protein n=1 Tax=Artemisia annua TaxID=35608 RepID=A0A2U1KF47_ARTAN|nr:hypothetical protein CTI12_AA610460 [Artemisia annua]